MIASARQVSPKKMREFTLFKGNHPPPMSRASGYIMPILAGYTAGKASNASSLVKIKSLLHLNLPLLFNHNAKLIFIFLHLFDEKSLPQYDFYIARLEGYLCYHHLAAINDGS
ncbi:hypothetical protein ACFLUO_10155 [Chloroflexota bacterium]